MTTILDQLRTQYWYWFIRDKLIGIKLNEKLTSKERTKLENLRDKPLLVGQYSDAKVGKDLDRIGKVTNGSFFNEFANNGHGSKYRSGTRVPNEHWITSAETIIPGSALAYLQGPIRLFSIIEAKDLPEATIVLAKELRHILASNLENLEKQCKLYILFEKLTLSLVGSMYSTFSVLNAVDEIINHLFPRNDWGKPKTYIEPIKIEAKDLNLNHLRQPRHLDLETLAVVVIGYAFIRARFFFETHYLSKVCYEEGFLKVIQARYLMSEKSWSFSQRKVLGHKNELNLDYVIKDRFNKAFRHSRMIDDKADFRARVLRLF
ncbi:hypothetical protein PALB_21040 [Pseudoalteromonas luteoviolacea B = ATCC 29581]|nr:hypothetical protein PALB_21040 [Pseudoalteromonas luteoviolacea B = ATCC 29581]